MHVHECIYMNLPSMSNLGCNGIFNGVYPANWHLMRMDLTNTFFRYYITWVLGDIMGIHNQLKMKWDWVSIYIALYIYMCHGQYLN